MSQRCAIRKSVYEMTTRSRLWPCGAIMTILVRCPTCASKLRVPEQAQGKRIKCPKCDCTFAARNEDDTPAEAEEGVTERPPVVARRRRPGEEEAEAPAPVRRKLRGDEVGEAPLKRKRLA